jgi:zinc transporter, ZIP family
MPNPSGVENLSSVANYASIAATALLAGGIVAILRKPGLRMRSVILHFAAGVVWEIVVGFGAGVVLMLALRYFLEPAEEAPDGGGFPTALIAIIVVDLLVDGVIMGIGFISGTETGTLLAVAISIELAALGMATATSLGSRRVTTRTAVLCLVGLALLVFVSAVLSAWLLGGIPDAYLEIVLSFGLAALLFLVTEELLVEAHEGSQSPLITAAFFAGFLLFMLLPG